MDTNETEYRVVIEGPKAAQEQLLHTLRKLESEAERNGVTVSVERIETEEVEDNPFS